MFDDIELTDCPEEYALNCKNYEIKCHECKANSSGKYLQYNPIDKNINEHPYKPSNKKKGVASYSRKGRTAEKKMIRDIPYLVSNYASGMIGGDGDAHIDLPDLGRIRVEIKNRFTKHGNIYPSAKEYREAATQKIQVIIIQHHPQNKMYAYLDFKLWTTMWRRIIFDNNIKMSDNDYCYGRVHTISRLKECEYGGTVEDCSLFLGEEKNADHNIYKDPRLQFSRMIITKDGKTVVMHINTLTEFIDLYNYVTLNN